MGIVLVQALKFALCQNHVLLSWQWDPSLSENLSQKNGI